MAKEKTEMQNAKDAAERLETYFAALSTDAETDYPEGHDPAEDARTVKEALGG